MKWEKLVLDINDESIVSKDGIPLCCCFSKKAKGKESFVMVPFFALDEKGEVISSRSKKKPTTPTASVLKKYKEDVEKNLKDEKKNPTHYCIEIHVGNYVGLVGDTETLSSVSYEVLKKHNE